MKHFAEVFQRIDLDEEALTGHRDGVVMTLSLLGGLSMGALALVHAAGHRWILVALNLALCAALLFNGARLQRGLCPALPFGWLAAGLIGIVAAAAWVNGMVAVLWSYPLLFMIYFALPRRLATLLSATLVLAMLGIVTAKLGADMSLRILISQVFVLLMVNAVLNLVGQLQRRLHEQAITDPLTGAYNRRHLQTELDRLPAPLLSKGTQAETPGPVLLALDIDHFKQINDAHGHDAGDEVLRRLVAVVSARKRADDLLFRTGGEEFMLLMRRIGHADALRLAETLRERVAEADLLPGAQVTVSIGLSGQGSGPQVHDWLKRADTALYAAKRAGRNRVEVAR